MANNAVATAPSVMGPGYKETIYVLNANNGAILGIPCTIPCRRMEIMEVPAVGSSANPQGLQYQLLQYDNTGLGNYGPVTEQDAPGHWITLGEQVGEWKGQGTPIGFQARPDPGRGTVPATVPILIQSASITATRVVVREYP